MGRIFHSLQGKLVLTVSGGLVILMFVAALAVMKLGAVVDGYRNLLQEDLHARSKIDAMNVDYQHQVQQWKNVLLRGHNENDMAKYWGRFEDTHNKIQKDAQMLVSALTSGEIKSRVSKFKSDHSGLLEVYRQGKDAFISSGFNPHAGDKAVKEIGRASSQSMTELSDYIERHSAEQATKLGADDAGNTGWALVEFLAVSLVMCGGLIWALRKQFIQPLGILTDHIRSMTEGDFSRQLDFDRDDELGALGKNLGKMKDDLSGMIASIRTTAEALNHAAGEINRSSDAISASTSEAENFSGQVAAAITEMAHTVTDVAGNAANAADATQTADQNAQEGLAVMGSALSAISNVATEVSDIASDITKLENDTTSVGAVLDVIKGIAEQTNLLALNAAIEAARTEEIQHIIEAVQNGATAATVAMQAGNQKTVEAVKLAEEAGNYIESISGAVGHIRDMNNQIAAAAEEQSVAAEQISRNIVNMSELAESAQSSAEGSRGVTRGLEQTSRDLTEFVGRFKI